MFGLSFGELLVLVVVAVVVIGPRELPGMLRKLGFWSGRLRRIAADLRAQSGIDEVLHAEGIADDLHEIRRLARGEMQDVMAKTRIEQGQAVEEVEEKGGLPFLTEHPEEGPDSYGALPDDANVYSEPRAVPRKEGDLHGDERDDEASLAVTPPK